MPRKRRKTTSNPVRNSKGDLVLTSLAGLPPSTLERTIQYLKRSGLHKSVQFVGTPATQSEQKRIYTKNYISAFLNHLEDAIEKYNPDRIMLFYVNSKDSHHLFEAVAYVCYVVSIDIAGHSDVSSQKSASWRHELTQVVSLISNSWQTAFEETTKLRSSISYKRISPFSLPAKNFLYPDRHSTIDRVYRELVLRNIDVEALERGLKPERFDRDALPQVAFKSSQNSCEFFKDARGRVFPPDRFHGRARFTGQTSSRLTLSLNLRQRYRFGVIVRDGNIHYDVQYANNRKLRGEPMYCADAGEVTVTGSHANVGVNDVIWVTGGTKTPI